LTSRVHETTPSAVPRLLLVYSGFGPYHLARWRAVRSQMADCGWEVVPVEILARQDRYNWGDDGGDGDIVRLGFQSDGRDQVRWRDAGRLLRTIASLRPDVVAVNGWALRDSILLHLWCRLRGVPRVVVTDTTAVDAPRTWLKESVKRTLLSGVGAAFAAGRASREYVETLGMPDEHTTIGCDVVDNAHFAVCRSSRGREVGPTARLLTVARLIPEKNLIPAANAFLSLVRTSQFDAVWTIAGYGPLEGELRRIAEESEGRIELLGSVSYSEMPSVMADADVLWLPSMSEPWGLVVNEAMAAGLPVAVSTSCGCAVDLVTDENGWTFDPSTPETLREALRSVLMDRPRWRAMGESSARIIADWDLDRFVTGLLEAGRIALAQDPVPN
jgi:glycosyltransferase involved in cell wall biosynthesis